MQLNLVILAVLLVASLWTAMARSLIRSAIGLALASAILTIIMFRLNSPLAAVFELSVCTGLVSVLFISAISLTHPSTREETAEHMAERFRKFKYLPFIIVVVGIALSFIAVKLTLQLPPPELESDVPTVLWNLRPMEIVGQVIILLSGVFGVVILFKEVSKK